MLSEPLPYHRKIRDYFKAQSGVWSFYSVPRKKEEHINPLRPDSDPLLCEKINIIRERLGLLPEEGHMVFNERILPLLNEQELSAYIAHELAHIKFLTLLDGELETTDRIIAALADNPDSGASYHETARLFRLYKEIFCDRVAYEVLGEAGPIITMLSKAASGLSPADVGARTRALHLWREKGTSPVCPSDDDPAGRQGPVAGMNGDVEAAITLVVEGVMELDRLDVLAQAALSGMTRALLIYYLQPEWFRTPVVVALAHQYFPDLEAGKETQPEGGNDGRPGPDRPKEGGASFPDKLKTFLAGAHLSVREYFAYVLLDLALVDPDLRDLSPGHARDLAEKLGLTPVLEPIIKKETTYSNDAH